MLTKKFKKILSLILVGAILLSSIVATATVVSAETAEDGLILQTSNADGKWYDGGDSLAVIEDVSETDASSPLGEARKITIKGDGYYNTPQLQVYLNNSGYDLSAAKVSGTIRFWVKVPHAINFSLMLMDNNWKNVSAAVSAPESDDWTEIQVPVTDFTGNVDELNWSNIGSFRIVAPVTATSSNKEFLGIDESMMITGLQVYSGDAPTLKVEPFFQTSNADGKWYDGGDSLVTIEDIADAGSPLGEARKITVHDEGYFSSSQLHIQVYVENAKIGYDLTAAKEDGSIRFWVQVQREISFDFVLMDTNWKNISTNVTVPASEGWTEIVIPISKFAGNTADLDWSKIASFRIAASATASNYNKEFLCVDESLLISGIQVFDENIVVSSEDEPIIETSIADGKWYDGGDALVSIEDVADAGSPLGSARKINLNGEGYFSNNLHIQVYVGNYDLNDAKDEGTIRFWMKVPHEIEFEFVLMDGNWKNVLTTVTASASEEWTEIIIPVKDFTGNVDAFDWSNIVSFRIAATATATNSNGEFLIVGESLMMTGVQVYAGDIPVNTEEPILVTSNADGKWYDGGDAVTIEDVADAVSPLGAARKITINNENYFNTPHIQMYVGNYDLTEAKDEGTLRFWIKVPHAISFDVVLMDGNWKNVSTTVSAPTSDDWTEIIVYVKDFAGNDDVLDWSNIVSFRIAATATATNSNSEFLIAGESLMMTGIEVYAGELPKEEPEPAPKPSVTYPTPWDELPEVSADDESVLVYEGDDTYFWCDIFNTGDDSTLRYSWIKNIKGDVNYGRFKTMLEIEMLDEEKFYKEEYQYILSFKGKPDLTKYLKTGTLRFWVKVPHDMDVKFYMYDVQYKPSTVYTTFKYTEENNGFYEVVIPLKDFYDGAIEGWRQDAILRLDIRPTALDAETFMSNGDVIQISPLEVWSKEAKDTSYYDNTRYYYSQLGCDIKLRDKNEVMPSTTVLRSFKNVEEEDDALKVLKKHYSGVKMLEYWSIYALSETSTDTRIETPYDIIDIMIPYDGSFAQKGLYAGLIGADGSVSIIPTSVEENWLVLSTAQLGDIAFFTAEGTVQSAAGESGEGGNSSTTSPLTSDQTSKLIYIWLGAFMLSVITLALVWYDSAKKRKYISSMLSLVLVFTLICGTLTGCANTTKPSSESSKETITSSEEDITSSDDITSSENYTTSTEDSSSKDDTTISEDTNISSENNSTSNTTSDSTQDNTVSDTPASTEKEELKMDIRVVDDHPGLPGYDAVYEFRAYVGTEFDMGRIDAEEFTLSCSIPEIKIDGNKVTVPASFKDNTDLRGVKIYATYNANKNVKASYPLQIINWSTTFSDEFEGDTLDYNLWTDETLTWHDYKDLGLGVTSYETDKICYLEDGKLVMPIIKNTEGTTYYSRGSTSDNDAFTPDYVQSKISTEQTFSQEFGCFTSRIKMAASNETNSGCNSALWFMPEGAQWGEDLSWYYKDGTLKGLGCGEIDLIEYSPAWGSGEWMTNEHSWDPATGAKTGENNKLFYNEKLQKGEYIDYAIVWTRTSLYLYVDGELIRTTENLEPTGKGLYIILTNAAAGVDPENPLWQGVFKDEDLDKLSMYVDYVKVYEAN